MFCLYFCFRHLITLSLFSDRWEGIFAGSDLNDGQWQNVRMAVNDSHVLLAANDEVTVHPITLVRSTNSSETTFNTSFSTTVLGAYFVLVY